MTPELLAQVISELEDWRDEIFQIMDGTNSEEEEESYGHRYHEVDRLIDTLKTLNAEPQGWREVAQDAIDALKAYLLLMRSPLLRSSARDELNAERAILALQATLDNFQPVIPAREEAMLTEYDLVWNYLDDAYPEILRELIRELDIAHPEED